MMGGLRLSSLNAAGKDDNKVKSVIVLWMAGGPSQLETFDPHPNSKIGGPTKSLKTAAKGVEIASTYPHLAEVMEDVTLIRSVVSKEGDHERGTYTLKTGYRPDPTLKHPSLGAVICHELQDQDVEIPRHISILSNLWAPRGGYLGDQYDAFKVNDPRNQIPDVKSWVSEKRQLERLKSLKRVEKEFMKGRPEGLDQSLTLHQHTMENALKMMSSKQLSAFDVSEAPQSEQKSFGDSRFGRGCLAAIRLVEAGVSCVEVTLNGWDTHANNFEGCKTQAEKLDPAFASLIKGLKERELLDSTMVVCMGEFGRTPKVNVAEGRDHWPQAFSIAVAGGGFSGGEVIGATDPSGEKERPENPVLVRDIHATILNQLGIDYEKEVLTPIGRDMMLSEGKVLKQLLKV